VLVSTVMASALGTQRADAPHGSTARSGPLGAAAPLPEGKDSDRWRLQPRTRDMPSSRVGSYGGEGESWNPEPVAQVPYSMVSSISSPASFAMWWLQVPSLQLRLVPQRLLSHSLVQPALGDRDTDQYDQPAGQ
jgi:hypothetical protein